MLPQENNNQDGVAPQSGKTEICTPFRTFCVISITALGGAMYSYLPVATTRASGKSPNTRIPKTCSERILEKSSWKPSALQQKLALATGIAGAGAGLLYSTSGADKNTAPSARDAPMAPSPSGSWLIPGALITTGMVAAYDTFCNDSNWAKNLKNRACSLFAKTDESRSNEQMPEEFVRRGREQKQQKRKRAKTTNAKIHFEQQMPNEEQKNDEPQTAERNEEYDESKINGPTGNFAPPRGHEDFEVEAKIADPEEFEEDDHDDAVTNVVQPRSNPAPRSDVPVLPASTNAVGNRNIIEIQPHTGTNTWYWRLAYDRGNVTDCAWLPSESIIRLSVDQEFQFIFRNQLGNERYDLMNVVGGAWSMFDTTSDGDMSSLIKFSKTGTHKFSVWKERAPSPLATFFLELMPGTFENNQNWEGNQKVINGIIPYPCDKIQRQPQQAQNTNTCKVMSRAEDAGTSAGRKDNEVCDATCTTCNGSGKHRTMWSLHGVLTLGFGGKCSRCKGKGVRGPAGASQRIDTNNNGEKSTSTGNNHKINYDQNGQ